MSRGLPGVGLADVITVKHRFVEVLIASVIVVLTAVFVYLVVRTALLQSFSPNSTSRTISADGRRATIWALVLTFVFSLCTSAWSTASRALWQHGPTMLMLAIALYLIQRAATRPGTIRYAALPLAFAFVIRPTNAIPIVLLSLYVFLTYRRRFPSYLLWSLPVAVPFLAYNLAVYHAPLSAYYHGLQPASPAVFFEGLAVHLVSPARGLFVFTPTLLLSVYGVCLKIRARQFQLLDALLVGIVFLEWVHMSYYWTGWAGYSFGPRFFTDMVPFFIYFLVPVAAEMARGTGLNRVALISAFLILSAASFFINYRGAMNWSTSAWNYEPVSMGERPNCIWDWHDVQFLRGL